MRRKIVIALLGLGTLVGYGSGLAHMAHAHRACHGWHGQGAEGSQSPSDGRQGPNEAR